MKKSLKITSAALALLIMVLALSIPVFAAGTADAAETAAVETVAQAESDSPVLGDKALAAGIAIGLAAMGGAIGMGLATAKSVEGLSRQPEAEGKIRTMFMLGLVFIETAIIYALIICILVIFVL